FAGPGPWRLEIVDPADVAALNDLLAAGVDLDWTDEGAVVVPRAAAEVAARVAREHGVLLSGTQTDDDGAGLERLQVAAAAPATELWALQEMGLDVTPISTESLNEGFDWAGIDTLYVSADLRWDSLDADAQSRLTAYLGDGGGLVARGGTGTALNEALDLLDVTTVAGPSQANGVVRIEREDTPIGMRATPQTFVYAPRWFTALGAGVVVDQRYAERDPLVSGHWRADDGGKTGPGDAAGQPLIVHGVDHDGTTAGAPVVLLGSEPLFRAHPKGQYALVARALIWSSLQDE
ncbi:MAG: peptidase M28, partial [Actinobacteria bacterium]|nr:peptidase M28 [Actinomycetota bacterium]